MKVKSIENVKKKIAKNNLLSNFIPLILGLFVGYVFSLVPIPLLHYLLYKDMPSILRLLILFSLISATTLTVYLGPKPYFGFTRKKARKTLFLGISISSFALGLWTFLNYPSILASDYSWLTGGRNIYLARPYILPGAIFVDVTLGALEFFIAAIVWEGFIGSFFAVLEHLLT